jgi:disulfide oxidoreductase YuzD
MHSITVTTGATVQGQLLARIGAVTLDNNTITNGICESTSHIPNDDEQDTDEETKPEDKDEDITTEVDKDITTEVDEDITTEVADDITQENYITPVVVEAPDVVVQETVTGGELPNTSSPWYSILFAGLGLMIISAISLKIIRRYEKN